MLPWQLHLEAAQQVLQQAIAAVGQNGREHLSNISSIRLTGDAGMLAALPAHSLTNLDVSIGLLAPVDGQAASAALARLSNLQQLHVASADVYSCLAGVAQLSQLTTLHLLQHAHYTDQISQLGNVQHLQQLLAQLLPLRVLRLHLSSAGDTEPLQLDMSNLTQLQVFVSWDQLDATFPHGLQQLYLTGISTEQQVEAVLQLQQLQRLEVRAAGLQQPQLLARLAQLPQLQHLSLHYNSASKAAATASAWQQLPALCGLRLVLGFDDPSIQEWVGILNGLAAATSLTSLDLTAVATTVPVLVEPGDEPGALEDVTVAACSQLAHLTNLRELTLCEGSCLVPGDALALTALTGLTCLDLQGVGAGVGDIAATAIAGSCKQLCHLDLRYCGLLSMGCLANVRHLTQLTGLRLEGNSGLTQQGLMQLTGLSRLLVFGVDRNAEVTNRVVKRFWRALRRRQQQ
jgi:hypothetical protein